MAEIIMSLIQNWHDLIIMFFVVQTIKIITNIVLKIYEIKHTNKDTIKFCKRDNETLIEITSSLVKISDIEKLKDTNLIDFKDSA